jgi:ubiquinone biosynthesis protein
VFDEQPIAAASIGQVHRARTWAGEWVAVKVQRPGVGELIDADLELLSIFIQSIRSMLPPADYTTIENEISTMVRGETDYVLEAEMMGKTAAFFADHPAIIVPEPVPELCGRQVLTSRFVDGRKISDVLAECAKKRDAGDQEAGRRLDRVMSLLLEAYVRMVLEAGVFQADPHPGNLLVTVDDELVVLDFGATKLLPAKVRDGYLAVVRAFIFGDRQRLAELLDELGFRTASGRPETLLMFAEILLQTMRQAVERKGALVWPTKEQLLSQASEVVEQLERDPVVSLPPEFIMTARVFGTLGGLFMHYRPNVDYAKALMPIIGQALAQSS